MIKNLVVSGSAEPFGCVIASPPKADEAISPVHSEIATHPLGARNDPPKAGEASGPNLIVSEANLCAANLKALFLCLLTAIFLQLAPASAPPRAEAQEVEFFGTGLGFLNLSLQDCIALALKNNFNVEIARLDPAIKEKGISVEKARFDPLLKVDGELRKDETPSNSRLISGLGAVAIRDSTQDINKLDTSIQVLTPLGSTVKLEWSVTRNFHTVAKQKMVFLFADPFTTNFLEASITQPLLKKAGIFYTRSLLYIARNDKKISLYTFKKSLIETANTVQKAYWDLVKAIEDLKVAHKSFQMAQELLQRNKLQVEAGIMAPIEIVAAEEEVAARKEAIIVAETAVKDKEDSLKGLMNLLKPGGDPILADITINPLDRPAFEAKKVGLEDSLATAMENRPELFEKKLELENSDIKMRRSKNELLPQLDFKSGVRSSGLGRHFGDSVDSMGSFDFQGQFFGLSLEVPLGLRAERANLHKARLEKRQSELKMHKQEQDILVQVRSAVRQVRANVQRIDATRKARELAHQRLDAEEKKFAVGRSTNLEILRAQDTLTTAEGNENKAITDYQMSLGNLQAVVGTILENYQVIMMEAENPSPLP